jgi:hypothetical protein
MLSLEGSKVGLHGGSADLWYVKGVRVAAKGHQAKPILTAPFIMALTRVLFPSS